MTDYFNTKLGNLLIRITYTVETRRAVSVSDPYDGSQYGDDELLDLDGMRGCTRAECAAWIQRRIDEYASV